MSKILKRIFTSLSISILIYLGIASGLTYFGGPDAAEDTTAMNGTVMSKAGSIEQGDIVDQGIDFSEMMLDYSDMPALQSYTARDGTLLDYRYYHSDSNKVLILLHGSGWHSQQFFPLAKYISEQGLAQVVTPDLRGHGMSPKRRGDIDYLGQFEDDLADLIGQLKQDAELKDVKNSSIIMGGHSSGGGLAIRFAGGEYGDLADAYLLLAPFIYYNAPTTRPNAGGWAKPYTARIIGLSMLNSIGIHRFDYLTSIEFNMPTAVRNGTETLAYSFRLNASFSPRDYVKALGAITQPLFLLAGSADETMFADKYQALISSTLPDNDQAEVKVLPGISHMGIVVNPDVRPAIKQWLREL
ncbi:Hydrolase, alpha/beta fold family (modular protein) [Shewanella benthica]|uniref:Hydrolase, alpha/beta fold family (Modular protein) n=1 Tax=Shewanella benthica TaxID=43661 RepID=A0A330LYF4_9GAMM|nr:alpha/beta fold hydrolase [Shewanella benthica]SQH75306.1 Hydrolase, alpha/beta fold family (modular protein) [Shewanella benthica]